MSKIKYRIENFENEDNRPLSEFFENPVLIKINELARQGWKVVTIIPWETEWFKEYMIFLEKE